MSDLRLERRTLLDKLIAEKAVRGYQLEFTTSVGDDHFGFVCGYSEDMLQVLVTPFGRERGNVKHKFEGYSLKNEEGSDLDYFVWLFIDQIESITENRLRLTHFDEYSRNKIQKFQQSLVYRSEKLVNPPKNGAR